MELKFDTSKTYAIALEGGGAKGAYEAGVWKALDEAGVKYDAVAGTSVGALNGAMMAARDLDTAVKLWENVKFSQVFDADDDQTLFQDVVQLVPVFCAGFLRNSLLVFTRQDKGITLTTSLPTNRK